MHMYAQEDACIPIRRPADVSWFRHQLFPQGRGLTIAMLHPPAADTTWRASRTRAAHAMYTGGCMRCVLGRVFRLCARKEVHGGRASRPRVSPHPRRHVYVIGAGHKVTSTLSNYTHHVGKWTGSLHHPSVRCGSRCNSPHAQKSVREGPPPDPTCRKDHPTDPSGKHSHLYLT